MLPDLQKACDAVGLKFVEVKGDLEDFIGSDPVIGYYFAPGPSPTMSTLALDIFILTDQCLYNHEISRKLNQYAKACYMIFLNQVTEIKERTVRKKEEEFISNHFETSGGSSIVLYDKIIRREDTRKFCLKIKDAIINRQKSTK